jgi:hypothetical protein
MNMQDKDLDTLFRSKLDSFEVEPSKAVWANINKELDEPKRKKFAWLSIAASVTVLVAAGLLFIPKKQDNAVKPKQPLQANIIKPATGGEHSGGVIKPIDAATQVQPAINTQSKQLVATAVVKHQTVQQPLVTTPKQTGAINNIDNTTTIDKPQETIAAVAPKQTVASPVLPTNETPLIEKTLITNTEPAKVYAAIPTDAEAKSPAKKHKVRGLGGFINAVVAVVDKRQDKIIEFTDTDEGDSVTGINLGIFKVKKDK